MENKILVTYGSKYGATKEIAEKIGDTLLRSGLQVDVTPAGQIQAFEPYQAVILGSAIYVGKWHKDAVEFLRDNRAALAQLPVWLFSSGPTGEGDAVELVEGKQLPSSLQSIADQIQPRDIAVFHGFINPARLNGMEKWAIKSLVKKPFGDFRKWDHIVSWASGIALDLKDFRN